MRRFAIPTYSLLLTVTLSAQKAALSDQDKVDAVALGTKAKGKMMGLLLTDTQAALAAGMLASPYARSATKGSTGFSLRIYTPKTWVEQLASDAAKQYAPFTVAAVTDEMTEPVLRVVVYPDKPMRIAGPDLAATSSVEHVVLRDERRTIAIQPLSKEPFTDVASSALRDVAYVGVVAKFPLDAVRELRGPKGDGEFFVTVIGAGTRERNFKIKPKHFERLP